MVNPDGRDVKYCMHLDDDNLFSLLSSKKYSLRATAAMTLMFREGEENYKRAYQLCFNKDFKLREM